MPDLSAAPAPVAPAVPATPSAAPVVPAPVVAAPAVVAPAVPAAPAAAPAPTGTLITPDGTQGAAGEPAPTAPADIKITVPEGFAADKGMLDGFAAFAKENKISQESAQKFADQYVASAQAAERQAQTQRAEAVVKWADEARTDPEIGGDKFDASIASAKRALQRFGSPELSKLLTESGLGNHKAVIRVLAQVGAKIGEDRMPTGSAPVSGEDPLRAMYPTMFKD